MHVRASNASTSNQSMEQGDRRMLALRAGTTESSARLPMYRWHITTALVLLYCASGCQFHHLRNANQDLERENFQLEQRLDEVTWQLEDAKAELAACQRAVQANAGAAPTTAPRRAPSRPAVDESSPSSPDLNAPPRVELPDGEARKRLRREPVPPFAGPPLISPPSAEVRDGTLGRSEPVAPTDDAPTYDAKGEESIASGMASPVNELEPPRAIARPKLVTSGASEPVASLVVNPKLTVWRKPQSDTSSDGGLQVVVEPRDTASRLTEASGDVAIAVLDPSQTGAAARLARWDFSADEVATRSKGTESGGGLHFRLTWPGAAPEIENLLLFVRLTTADGQQYVAEYALQPTSEANPAAAWTEVESPARRDMGPRLGMNSANGWQRATTPLSAREEPSPEKTPPDKTAPGAMDPKDAASGEDDGLSPAGTTETGAESSGPSWAPYR
jgi:hypothetical protein